MIYNWFDASHGLPTSISIFKKSSTRLRAHDDPHCWFLEVNGRIYGSYGLDLQSSHRLQMTCSTIACLLCSAQQKQTKYNLVFCCWGNGLSVHWDVGRKTHLLKIWHIPDMIMLCNYVHLHNWLCVSWLHLCCTWCEYWPRHLCCLVYNGAIATHLVYGFAGGDPQ